MRRQSDPLKCSSILFFRPPRNSTSTKNSSLMSTSMLELSNSIPSQESIPSSLRFNPLFCVTPKYRSMRKKRTGSLLSTRHLRRRKESKSNQWVSKNPIKLLRSSPETTSDLPALIFQKIYNVYKLEPFYLSFDTLKYFGKKF